MLAANDTSLTAKKIMKSKQMTGSVLFSNIKQIFPDQQGLEHYLAGGDLKINVVAGMSVCVKQQNLKGAILGQRKKGGLLLR